MSNEQESVIHGASDGGVTGGHPETAPLELLLAPTTSNDFNRVTLRLIPVACWKIEDIRFAFDSSFVTPEASTELQALKELREFHSKEGPAAGASQKPILYPPLSIFGHADPVGPAVDPDGFNKALSGRRATAIYALLISGTQPAKAASLWQG